MKVGAKATPTEIKQAYRREAKRLHPDINPSPTAKRDFILLNQAYQGLLRGQETLSRPTAPSARHHEAKRRHTERENARRYAEMRYSRFKKESEDFRSDPYILVYKALSYLLLIAIYLMTGFLALLPIGGLLSGNFIMFLALSPFFGGSYFMYMQAKIWRSEMHYYFEQEH